MLRFASSQDRLGVKPAPRLVSVIKRIRICRSATIVLPASKMLLIPRFHADVNRMERSGISLQCDRSGRPTICYSSATLFGITVTTPIAARVNGGRARKPSAAAKPPIWIPADRAAGHGGGSTPAIHGGHRRAIPDTLPTAVPVFVPLPWHRRPPAGATCTNERCYFNASTLMPIVTAPSRAPLSRATVRLVCETLTPPSSSTSSMNEALAPTRYVFFHLASSPCM